MMVPLPLQDKGGAGGAEMPDVQAFGGTDPRPAGKRLVDVPEYRVPRPGGLNRVEQSHAAYLEPPRHGVVEKLGDGRRNVGTQYVYLTDRLELGPELLLGHLVRRVIGRFQATADETERPAADFHGAAVQHPMPGFQVPRPHSGDVDVAVGQVGGFGQGG